MRGRKKHAEDEIQECEKIGPGRRPKTRVRKKSARAEIGIVKIELEDEEGRNGISVRKWEIGPGRKNRPEAEGRKRKDEIVLKEGRRTIPPVMPVSTFFLIISQHYNFATRPIFGSLQSYNVGIMPRLQ